MRFDRTLTTIFLVLATADQISGQKNSSVSPSHRSTSTPSVCAARTINYITHTLPQSCLTTSWAGTEPSSDSYASHSIQAPESVRPGAERSSTHDAAEDSLPDTATVASPSTSFMSFEDWKEMMLRRTGQNPQDLGARKPNDHGKDSRAPLEPGHAGLGEEDEISLNFENFIGTEEHAPPAEVAYDGNNNDQHKVSTHENSEDPVYLSKDAGKTCKERFSYSSFDAGATILKTSPRAKNAKAILAENKDSYMLLECAAENKYVVVELSDDILVDTVVLANFEFFSSMIRQFRVSVSDRYPAKAEKWRDLGTFEARNSRDIQPFLVENPQIWAKYVRIDFVSHYGNEYYCPVSLLRVHGSRMLDSWKDADTGVEEDMPTLLDAAPDHQDSDDLVAVPVDQVKTEVASPSRTTEVMAVQQPTSPRVYVFEPLNSICTTAQQPGTSTKHESDKASFTASGRADYTQTRQPNRGSESSDRPPESRVSEHIVPMNASIISNTISQPTVASPTETRPVVMPNSPANTAKASTEPGPDPASSTPRQSPSNVAGGKNRNTGTSGGTAASTVQEGFFNAITKRLQQVESNLTLSLKYVEDQSKHMQDALQQAEQKQSSRVNTFLDSLNQTVLAELRSVREQYDQIWQSTVIALESHRDQSEREILALGTRLNLLADEVVFQKRMAIVQAVLLLSCLFLVIFSRGVPIPYLAPLLEQGGGVPYANTVPSTVYKHDFYNVADDARHSDPGLTDMHHDTPYSMADSASRGTNSALDEIPLPSDPIIYRASDTRLDPAEFHNVSPPTILSDLHGEQGKSLSAHSSNETLGNDPRLSHRYVQTRKPLPALPEHGASQSSSD